MTTTETARPAVTVVQPTKSVGLALVLAGLFGPIGMLYSTVIGGLVMFLPTVVIMLFTFGFGYIFLAPICILWAGVSASSYNKKLIRAATQVA